jgi:hypothetical protein
VTTEDIRVTEQTPRKGLTPLEAFALHASTTCTEVCGRSFANGDTDPCPVGDCLLSCMGLVQKAARWVEEECRTYGDRPGVSSEEAENAAVLGEVLASGLLACEHMKEGS